MVGGRWEIQSQFTLNQKDAAIEKARKIEKATSRRVKVVRDIFDEDTGLYKESIIFRGRPPPGSTAPQWASESVSGSDFAHLDDGDGADGLADGHSGSDKRGTRAKRKKYAGDGLMISGVALLIVSNLGAAASLSWIAWQNQALREWVIDVLGLSNDLNVLVIIFLGALISFLLISSLLFLINFKQISALFLIHSKQVSAEKSGASGVSGLKKKVDARILPLRRDVLFQQSIGLKPLLPGEYKEQGYPSKSILSAAGESQRLVMNAFLDTTTDEIRGTFAKMDTFNRFGLSLFFAGASEAVSANDELLPGEATKILAEAVQATGAKPDVSQHFATTYDEYLQTNRYAEMFEAGRAAAIAYVGGDKETPEWLHQALEKWNQQTGVYDHPSEVPIAILFTDIARSTEIHEMAGDQAARYIVQVHDRIVRQVIGDYYGKEIKHLGDGIMASFKSAANAVRAALVIQKRISAHSKAEKDLPLQLRIGVNVGEPIQSKNDLHGISVNLAARICSAAEAEKVLVSEGVKVMCAGKDIHFEERGTRNLKGIPKPTPVFEPVWNPTSEPFDTPQ